MKLFKYSLVLLALASCKHKPTPQTTSGLTGYIDLVARGVDNTGATDVSAAIMSYVNNLNSDTPAVIYFAPGHYKIDAGLVINAHSNTYSGVKFQGAARDSVYLDSACTNGYALWYNNTTNSGDNFEGAAISHMTFRDTSPASNACMDVLRFTQTAENVIDDVKVMNAKGLTYSTGKVTVSGQNVTGTGTIWASRMAHGILQINSVVAEICTIKSASTATLCSNSFPTGNQTNVSYAIAYGGRALTFDPGYSYTQYISVRDFFSWNNLYGIFSMGVSSGGNSRISIEGKAGWIGISGARIPNSIGVYLGKHSDTFLVSIPVNNVSKCFVLESAHANSIVSADCENNSNTTPVTTCNGGTASQSCLDGYEISSDANSSGYGNSITNPYVYLTGMAFQIDNAAGARTLNISGLRGDTFANTNNYQFVGTTGCPSTSSYTTTTILNWDCTHFVQGSSLNTPDVPTLGTGNSVQ